MKKIIKLFSCNAIHFFYLGSLLLLLFSSCNPYKKIVYFRNIPDSLHTAPLILNNNTYADPTIQPNDILEVGIQTLDPQVSGMPGSSSSSSSSFSTLSALSGIPSANGQQPANTDNNGFLVDKNGFVDLPLAGKIKVSDLTTAEARDTIAAIVSGFFINPVVNVRIANFKITVIGEVNRPTQYIIHDEKVSILDAIGLAGDLTIFGKRDNVLLIRTVKKHREFIRFDLNSSEIFNSPYFYLRQGDVVYVEPNKAKAATTDAAQTRNLSFITSAFTVFVVILSDLILR